MALIEFLTLTDCPETARWLSQEEMELATTRIKSERAGTAEVLDNIDLPETLRGIFSPVTLTTPFVFLLFNMTVQGLSFLAPPIVQTIYPNYSVVFLQITQYHYTPSVLSSLLCSHS